MRIAVVGTGPTGIYSFMNLISAGVATDISLYEMGERVGVGIPYSRETASRVMLANIASIEIPPVIETYLDWLMAQDADYLKAHGIDRKALTKRSFTPRVVLGDYFHDQMKGLIAQAEASGINVTVNARCRVTDVARDSGGIRLTTDPATGQAPFDKVILATGHVFEDDDDLADNYFPNPWSGLIDVEVPAARIAIMGTSLSAIDAAMAVAIQHGRFVYSGDGLRYQSDETGQLMLTLMSWSGILPEADFYCPIPYTPLEVMTDDALRTAARQPDIFEAVYRLFRDQIIAADPDWAARVDLPTLTPEGFEKAYFHDREVNDPFRWARINLDEAEANHRARRTVPWRYAILRMHEKIEALLPEFTEEQRDRFDRTLKKVFVDNYAAVPPESIRRLLALRDAGVLTVLPLGDDYDMTDKDGETVIIAHGRRHVFDVFIDARGQKPMASQDLPYPTLRDALLDAGFEQPEIGEDYGLMGLPGYSGHLYLAALPFLMQDQPFVQGFTACADIGRTIAKAEAKDFPRRRRVANQRS